MTKTPFEFTTPYLEALDNIDRDFDQKASRLFDVETMLNDAKEHNASDERVKALEAEIEKLDRELEEIAVVADDFGIVLPVSEIVSINIFSEYIHAKYFAPKTPPGIVTVP